MDTPLAVALETRVAVGTREDLVARFGRSQLDRALRDHRIVRVLPGVYAARARAAAFDVRARAASAWLGPGAAVGGNAACHLLAEASPEPRVIHAWAPRSDRPRAPGWLVVHRPLVAMEPVMAGGVRVSAPDDAVIQAWMTSPVPSRASVVIEAVRRGLVLPDATLARLEQYGRVRHRRALIDLLQRLAPGIESFLELEARSRVFVGREFARLESQVVVQAAGERYRLDLFDRATRTAIELDGAAFHGSDSARRRDLDRDARLNSVGIATVRLTYEDIMNRPAWARRIVRETLRARSNVVP